MAYFWSIHFHFDSFVTHSHFSIKSCIWKQDLNSFARLFTRLKVEKAMEVDLKKLLNDGTAKRLYAVKMGFACSFGLFGMLPSDMTDWSVEITTFNGESLTKTFPICDIEPYIEHYMIPKLKLLISWYLNIILAIILTGGLQFISRKFELSMIEFFANFCLVVFMVLFYCIKDILDSFWVYDELE